MEVVTYFLYECNRCHHITDRLVRVQETACKWGGCNGTARFYKTEEVERHYAKEVQKEEKPE